MNTNRSLPLRVALVAPAVAAGLVLTGPGGAGAHPAGSPTVTTTTTTTTTPTTPPQTERHNQADVTFAQRMIPHHRQAVMMTAMVESHGASDQVKALAERMEKVQKSEIETMTGWLRAWGEKVPVGMGGMGYTGEMPGMGHGDDDFTGPGMMNDEDLRRIDRAEGNAFDTMFLTRMIEHHEGAIAMAKTEQQRGAYGPAKALADAIVTSQTAEIAQMRAMLGAG
ncbi:DUF305 domain-containing protein [Streptomyces sp. NPDC006430]|uniref:DUF305 domain-containing protein n=1 Tax=Streptomyces sp. NPDC006430 TaxID=3154299 RepID=UPI0033BBFAEB